MIPFSSYYALKCFKYLLDYWHLPLGGFRHQATDVVSEVLKVDCLCLYFSFVHFLDDVFESGGSGDSRCYQILMLCIFNEVCYLKCSIPSL